jgi:eukaryotic-like serine/threonine-protein kinase
MATQETLLNGRYQLVTQQGSGGMAVVYKAQDLALGRTVAIKILRPSLTGDTAFLTRFRQEARNVANLAHPNIVTLYDVGQDGNTYYMVMEFVDGQDLKKVIRTNAPFSVERTLNLGIQICAGLGYAHRAGLVHADVKPQNILITGNDHVKITDFGIAQALSHTQPLAKQSVVWGSPHYFSPEQASGEAPTPASDVYAIGIVLFEMLTGRLPYNGNDQQELAMAHIRDQIPHVRDLNPNVPANVDWIVSKVMSKEPSARYRTADQLGRILISYQKQLENPASPAPVEPAVSQASVTVPPAQPAVTYQSSYTPPPQQPQQFYTSAPRPVSGNTPAEPARPVTGQSGNYAYPSDATGGASGTGGMRANAPNYQYASAPSHINMATIVLGCLAFLAVLGLIALWLVVWNAYT